MLTLDQLTTIMPFAKTPQAFLSPLNQAMAQFNIDTRGRRAMFLAQVAHESAQLEALSENLNYSATGLIRTWPARFPASIATFYDRQPEKIANRAYANRMGNGPEESGDGWKYRGAGAIQLTGKANHVDCARAFNLSPDDMPAWLRTPLGACLSAGWIWQRDGLNTYADVDDFDGVCDKINLGHKTARDGDAVGYAERRHFYDLALRVLA